MTSTDAHASLVARAASLVLDVADFPTAGILFKDLTPVLADPIAFAQVVAWMARPEVGGVRVEAVAGIEARGFVLGAPVALALGVPFVPVRKAGRLPRAVLEQSYDLEYGSATLAVHADAPIAGAGVLLVDDVLATGGTADAARMLVERAGGQPLGLVVLLELGSLAGRERLGGLEVRALLVG